MILISVYTFENLLTSSIRAVKSPIHQGRLEIHLEVNSGGMQLLDNKFRPYAEVWGINDQGQEVPVCWLSSMQKVSGVQQLTKCFVLIFAAPLHLSLLTDYPSRNRRFQGPHSGIGHQVAPTCWCQGPADPQECLCSGWGLFHSSR